MGLFSVVIQNLHWAFIQVGLKVTLNCITVKKTLSVGIMVGHHHVKVMSLILEAGASVSITFKLILSFQYVLTLGNLVEEIKDGRITQRQIINKY